MDLGLPPWDAWDIGLEIKEIFVHYSLGLIVYIYIVIHLLFFRDLWWQVYFYISGNNTKL